mmetsp:Transcript_19536/g.54949  ORF Transcript_19536/g.54949 Transcript_19536/m.54949 type:complete len:233 (-) Transcript_19536:1327-2025(-)
MEARRSFSSSSPSAAWDTVNSSRLGSLVSSEVRRLQYWPGGVLSGLPSGCCRERGSAGGRSGTAATSSAVKLFRLPSRLKDGQSMKLGLTLPAVTPGRSKAKPSGSLRSGGAKFRRSAGWLARYWSYSARKTADSGQRRSSRRKMDRHTRRDGWDRKARHSVTSHVYRPGTERQKSRKLPARNVFPLPTGPSITRPYEDPSPLFPCPGRGMERRCAFICPNSASRAATPRDP